MGYDISLVNANGESVQVERHSEGGNMVATSVVRVGKRSCSVYGTTNAEISVTYNYSKFLYDTIDEEQGIRWLYGKNYSECVERLETAIGALGTDRDEDYWAATAGNTGHIISVLLSWAKQNPTATFIGD